MISRAVVMWSAHGHAVGMRSRVRRPLVISRAGTAMMVSRSVLVVTRPSPAALAVHREVVGDRDDGQPGGVGGEHTRGQVRQAGVVFEVADGVFDDGVAAVVGLHGQQRPVAVGQDRVVGEHHVEGELGAGGGPHAADDQPRGGLMLGALKRGVGGLGDVGAAVDPVRDRDPRVISDGVDRAWIAALLRAVIE